MQFLLQLSNRALFLLTVAFLFAGQGVNGLVLPEEDLAAISKRSAKPIEIPFSVSKTAHAGNKTISRFHEKRDAQPPLTLQNEGVEYLVDVYLGTPQQKFSVQVDTGSSDFWVINQGADWDSGDYSGQLYPEFDEGASSTFQSLDRYFSITYGDHSTASGIFGSDVFSFTEGQNLLNNVIFTPADSSTAGFGLIGIARNTQESEYPFYDNVITQLVKQNVIPKESYSIYLNSAQAQTGTLILGGYDKAKIDGPFPKLPTDDSVYLSVALGGISYNGQTHSSGSGVILDTGTTETVVPPDVFEFLGQAIPNARKTTIKQTDYWHAPCDGITGDITYKFDGVDIKVNIKDLSESNGQGDCLVHLPNSGSDGVGIFGDTFLRSAYVYYDLTDNVIGLGQAKFTSESNIVSD